MNHDTAETDRLDDGEDAATTTALHHEDDEDENDEHGIMIVRNIASFLTISDAASIASTGIGGGYTPYTPGENSSTWGVGSTPFSYTSSSSRVWPTICTPPTPALVAVSPNPPGSTAAFDDDGGGDNTEVYDDARDYNHTGVCVDIDQQRRNWAQEKLASAVFEHPQSLRSYCLDAYLAAKGVNENGGHLVAYKESPGEIPETTVEPDLRMQQQHNRRMMTRHNQQQQQRNNRLFFIHFLIDQIFNNVPLSVFIEVVEGVTEVSLDSSFAVVKITNVTTHKIFTSIVHAIGHVWDQILNFNPFELLHAMVSHPFNAMGKTTEVVVSGIQSVATGVGSASSMALHRLSIKTEGSYGSSSMLFTGQHSGSLRRVRSRENNGFNKKLLRKLSTMHSAASVISYTEIKDDTGGLSRHAKSRVQRMMHYEVSLRPFVATVKLPINETFHSDSSTNTSVTSNKTNRAGRETSTGAGGAASKQDSESTTGGTARTAANLLKNHNTDASESSASSSPQTSPFMCTPQSFPPTPSSRRMVLARGTRFADDVIFLARDQLRVHDALDSKNERTREMAQALTQGKRLAVFDADDASTGIDLTCGQHVATKVGNMLYCSTRSMVPILRNCFVYFEMTVLPRPGANLIPQVSMATLSVGLSTKEMPPNTLVGAWKGSVGLCTTGQLLTAGQWCSPADPTVSSFGDRATVGCLVCLDDGSAFETWDGVMVTAAVTFNVNQQVVSPPITAMPIVPAGSAGASSSNTEERRPHQATSAGPSTFTLPLLVPAEEELYPTVTLHSPGTAVMCRFSAEDTMAKSRKAIGAPAGVTIYSADGSVMMTESDDLEDFADVQMPTMPEFSDAQLKE